VKLIILDRDGVINHDSDEYIKSPDEWIAVPGSLEAIAELNRYQYHVVVVTNQSGITRGLLGIETLHRIHEKMHRLVHKAGGMIDAVLFCTSTDDNHPDRKPNPGMLLELSKRLEVDLKGVPMVGDSLRDIQAARAVGAQPILVRSGKGNRTLMLKFDKQKLPIFENLAEASRYVIASAAY